MKSGMIVLALVAWPALALAQSTQEIIDSLKDDTLEVGTRSMTGELQSAPMVEPERDERAPAAEPVRSQQATASASVSGSAPASLSARAYAAPAPASPRAPGRIELRDVQFYFDSPAFLPDSRPTLDNIAAALRSPELATMRLRIVGHTDASGSAGHNQLLSDRRAEAVIDWLARHGVSRDRLEPVGMASRAPKYADTYDPRNRRVEIAR